MKRAYDKLESAKILLKEGRFVRNMGIFDEFWRVLEFFSKSKLCLGCKMGDG